MMEHKEESCGQNLISLIKQLLKEKQYDGIGVLFTSAKEAQRNVSCLADIAMELYHGVCLPNLNDETHRNNLALYSCVENLLKTLAAYAPVEELLLELLEVIEENKSEFIFTTTLRILQIVLLRQSDEKPRALEWSLNSIKIHLSELPLPDCLKEGYEEKEKQLFEQDEKILTFLTHYITVGLFYEPLLLSVCQKSSRFEEENLFRSYSLNRRNVLCCFLLNLLSAPFSCLNLDIGGQSKTNTYTVQCVVSLTQGVTKCVTDPYFFLNLVQERVRWAAKPKVDLDTSRSNIFLSDDKLPLECLAIYYYMILVEGIDQDKIPLVYHPIFIFESVLYLAYQLLCSEYVPLHEKGLDLATKLLQQLHERRKISVLSLELELHKSFCTTLCNVVAHSPYLHVRKKGLRLLRQYIVQFENEGKYLILRNLFDSLTHNGIIGYLVIIYKDLVSDALLSTTAQLPKIFSGQHFRAIVLENICHLPHGLQTDLLDQTDKITSALNTLRFFSLKDTNNRTGFWDLRVDLETNYIDVLRQILDGTVAHYKAKVRSLESGAESKLDEVREHERLNLVDVTIGNDKQAPKLNMELDAEQKIGVLQQNLCTLDLIKSLLGRLVECLSHRN